MDHVMHLFSCLNNVYLPGLCVQFHISTGWLAVSDGWAQADDGWANACPVHPLLRQCMSQNKTMMSHFVTSSTH